MITAFLIIFLHFVADFLCQTDKMAVNKSKSMKWLTIHALTYIAVMSPIGLFNDSWSWVVVNFILHWCTDFCTSRLTSYLLVKGTEDPNGSWMGGSWRHWFFSVIGLDQVIHYGCLFFTYQYFLLS